MKSLFIGQELIRLPVIDSTNNYAAMLVSSAKWSEGTVIVADDQTAGKGRHDRKWMSSPGKNLTFSILLKPHFLSVDQAFLLSMASALSVTSVIGELLPAHEARIKWPNDIYVGRKKIAGILIQQGVRGTSLSYAIIGIGFNVNEENLESISACSLLSLSGHSFDRDEVLRMLIERFEAYYLRLRSKQNAIIEEYHHQLMNLGIACDYQLGEKNVAARLISVKASGRALFEIDQQQDEYDIDQIKFLR